MATVHIDLQEGWDGDDVLIFLDGIQCRRIPEARTRTQIGLATQIEQETSPGRRTIAVSVPGRSLQGTHVIDVKDEHWVAVSIEENRLTFRDQPELYGYV